MDDIGTRSLLLFAAAALSAVGIEAWRRRATARRAGAPGAPPGRWPAPLVPFCWLAANLVLFLAVFPPFEVSSLLYDDAFSWSEVGILFGLPAALLLMFLALRPERRAGLLTLKRTLSLAGCLTLILPLVLCPVVIIAVLLSGVLWQVGVFDMPELGEQAITLGDAALLLVAVVVCAVVLFQSARRFGKRPGPLPDPDQQD